MDSEDWPKYGSWDIYVNGVEVNTLQALLYFLGVLGSDGTVGDVPTPEQTEALRSFMERPAWTKAPPALKKQVKSFIGEQRFDGTLAWKMERRRVRDTFPGRLTRAQRRSEFRSAHQQKEDDVRVAVDLDGTIDAYPRQLQSLCSALKAAGFEVNVVTGTSGARPTKEEVAQRTEYLNNLGFTDSAYDGPVVCLAATQQDPLHKVKAQWCKDNHVDVLIDNNTKNAKAATELGILALVPWATRQGKKDK